MCSGMYSWSYASSTTRSYLTPARCIRLTNTRPSSSWTFASSVGREAEVLAAHPHDRRVDLDGIDRDAGKRLLHRHHQGAAAHADDEDPLRRRHEVESAEHELRVVEDELRGLGQRRARLAHADVAPERHAAQAVVLVDDDVAVERALAMENVHRRHVAAQCSEKRAGNRGVAARATARVAVTVHRETAARPDRRRTRRRSCRSGSDSPRTTAPCRTT